MDYSKMDIVDVGLSVRSSVILLRAGIISVEDMFRLTEADLVAMCDADKSSLDEILAKKNECANGIVKPFKHREKGLGEDAGKQMKASSVAIPSEYNMQTSQQSQATTSSANCKVSNVENKRAKLDAFVLELQKRYPEGSKLPTSILELFKNNKDLPVNNAGSWSMAVYQTTLSAYLRERHLLEDNPTTADRQENQTIASVRTTSSAAVAQTNSTPLTVPSVKSQRSIQDKERLDTVITVLRRRYPNMASEGTLANLKRNNPDLNIGSLYEALASKPEGMREKTCIFLFLSHQSPRCSTHRCDSKNCLQFLYISR